MNRLILGRPLRGVAFDAAVCGLVVFFALSGYLAGQTGRSARTEHRRPDTDEPAPPWAGPARGCVGQGCVAGCPPVSPPPVPVPGSAVVGSGAGGVVGAVVVGALDGVLLGSADGAGSSVTLGCADGVAHGEQRDSGRTGAEPAPQPTHEVS
ncbi:hypothetical protein, partial [Micromonospora aurantiaca (nom. illeg.)]|uniref:hypothetical protein n=1 Tax=Micromonospora aurantiaca (nom. illeg.) TaxID=47850 RepID=UPI0033FD4CE5